MRRELAGLLVVLCLAGCGGGEEEQASPLDRLVDDVAAGGKARERAAQKLAKALESDDPALADVQEDRVGEALRTVTGRLRPLVGEGPPVCGSWAYEPRYADHRYAAELLLDVARRTGRERT